MIRLWDAVTGEQRFEMAHPDTIAADRFNSDGSRVLTLTGDIMRRANVLWDVETGRELATLAGDYGESEATFSPDERLMAKAYRRSSLLRGRLAQKL